MDLIQRTQVEAVVGSVESVIEEGQEHSLLREPFPPWNSFVRAARYIDSQSNPREQSLGCSVARLSAVHPPKSSRRDFRPPPFRGPLVCSDAAEIPSSHPSVIFTGWPSPVT